MYALSDSTRLQNNGTVYIVFIRFLTFIIVGCPFLVKVFSSSFYSDAFI